MSIAVMLLILLISFWGTFYFYTRLVVSTFDEEVERRLSAFQSNPFFRKRLVSIYSSNVPWVFRKHRSAFPRSQDRKLAIACFVLTVITGIVLEEMTR
jgi:hypothetical protein